MKQLPGCSAILVTWEGVQDTLDCTPSEPNVLLDLQLFIQTQPKPCALRRAVRMLSKNKITTPRDLQFFDWTNPQAYTQHYGSVTHKLLRQWVFDTYGFWIPIRLI